MCRSAATKSEELVGPRGIGSCPDPTESNSPCSLHKTCNFPMVNELLNLADLFDGHLSGFAVDDYGLLALYLLFQFERPSLRFIRTEPETSRSLSRRAVRGRSGG